ncbi:MAG TPA: hypothetical protein VLE23_17600 [Geminicoccaceae bacterium]|nr:hypothetical protein [Geminicoccaceae bacterium]
MVERIRHLLDRFPEDEETIRGLIEGDTDFAALCQEYQQTEQELQRLEGEGAVAGAAEAAELRHRYEAIEEELLARIEGYRPV